MADLNKIVDELSQLPVLEVLTRKDA